MSRTVRYLPILLLVAVLGALAWRLANPADTQVRSKLQGKPVPAFALPAAVPGKPGLAAKDLSGGEPRLLNFFASWCVPCVAEAPVLGSLRKQGVAIDAVAIRDRPEDVARFLARYGDPYARIGADYESRIQLALGSSGVPESFVVNGHGLIRYQHIGPIAPGDVPAILAELEKAR